MNRADKILRALELMPGCTTADMSALTGMPSQQVHQVFQNAKRAGEVVGKRVEGKARYWLTPNYSKFRVSPHVITDALKKAGTEMRAKDIAKSLGVTGYKIRHRMSELHDQGIVAKRVDSHGAVFWRLLDDTETPEYPCHPSVSGAQAHKFLSSVRWKPAKNMAEFLVSMTQANRA